MNNFPCGTCCSLDMSCCSNPQIIWSMTELDALVTAHTNIFDNVIMFKAEMPGFIYLIDKNIITNRTSDDIKIDNCAFYDVEAKRCSIYDYRPFVCSSYGNKKYNACPYEGMSDDALTDLIKNNKELAKEMHKTSTSFPDNILEDYIGPYMESFLASEDTNPEYMELWNNLPTTNFSKI